MMPRGRWLQRSASSIASKGQEASASAAVVQGSAFGLSGYLRIAYALDDESLRAACQAIHGFCEDAR